MIGKRIFYIVTIWKFLGYRNKFKMGFQKVVNYKMKRKYQLLKVNDQLN